MSLKKYRFIDLSILFALSLLVEVVTSLVFYYLEIPRLYISVTYAVTRIAIIRWNKEGVLVGVLSGLLSQIIRSLLRNSYSAYGFLVTSLPYLTLAFLLLFFRKEEVKEKRNSNLLFLLLYSLAGFLLLEAGRRLCEIGNEEYYSTFAIQRGCDLLQRIVSTILLVLAFFQHSILIDRDRKIKERKKENATARRRKERFDYYRLEEIANGNDINDAALLDGGTLSTEELKIREEERRKIEGKESFFEKENKERLQYLSEKKNKGGNSNHGKSTAA